VILKFHLISMSFSVQNQPFLSHFLPDNAKKINTVPQLHYRHSNIFLSSDKCFLLFFRDFIGFFGVFFSIFRLVFLKIYQKKTE